MKVNTTKRQRAAKRVLSIVLAAAMMAGLFGVLGLVPANAASSLSKAAGSGTQNLKFYVPELIYLKPWVSGGAAQNMNAFQYFVGRNTDGSLDTKQGGKTTGTVYFSFPGATLNSITLSGATVSLSNGATGATNVTAVNGSNDNITGGTLGSALGQDSSATLTWTAQYTWNDRTYTTLAYTYVWAPLAYANSTVSTMGNAWSSTNSTRTYIDSGSWLTGVHSIDVSMGKFQDSGGNNGNTGTGGFPHPPLAILWARNTETTPATVTYTNPNATITYSNTIQNTNASDGHRIGLVSGGTGAFSGCGSDKADLNWGYGAGVITIDKDRYTNFSYIPNLCAGIDHYGSVSSPQTRTSEVGISTSVAGNTTNILGNASMTDPRRRWNWIDYNFNTATTTYYVTGHSYCIRSNSYENVYTTEQLKCTFVSNATLRAAVDNAQSWSFLKADQNTTLWGTYETALKNAYEYLGNPKANQDTINSYATALNNAVSALVSGTAYARHYNRAISDTTLIAQESTTYGSATGRQSVTGTAFSSTSSPAVSSDDWYYIEHYNTDHKSVDSETYPRATTSSTITKAYGTGAWGNTLYWNFYYYPIYTVQYTAPAISPDTSPYSPMPSGTEETIKTTYSISNQTLSATYPTSRTGYTFNGWQITNGSTAAAPNDNGGTARFAAGASIPNNLCNTPGTVTLTATWKKNTYKVAYDKNSDAATGTMTPSDHEYDTDKALTPIGFSRTGYTFEGWYLNSGCTGTRYANGESVKNLASATGAVVNLYAKWKPNTLIVIFDHAGGKIGTLTETVPVTVTYDGYYTIPTGLPSYPGWEFQGWYKDTTKITNDTKVTNATIDPTDGSTTRFYAKWEKATYTLVFNFEGGSIGTDNGPQEWTQRFDDPMRIPTPNPSRIGYIFSDWWTSATGGTKLNTAALMGDHALNAAARLNPTEKVPYFAHWTELVYRIIWDLQGGLYLGNPANQNTPVTYSERYFSATDTALEYGDPTRDGYLFGGWFTKENGDGIEIDKNTLVTDATLDPMTIRYPTMAGVPTVFYAKWMYTGEYKLKYLLNDGTLTEDNKTAKAVDLFAVPTNMPVDPERTGYTFAGWFTAPTGGTKINAGYTTVGSVLDPASLADYAVSTKIYAQWTPKPYDVVFKDGSDETTKSVTYGEKYTLPPQPTKTGYVFAGWYEEDLGFGKITNVTPADNTNLSDTDAVSPSLAATFYAHWTPITYTLRYDFNVPDAALIDTEPGPFTVTYNATAMNPAPTAPDVEKEGYTLDHWDVTINGVPSGTLAATDTPSNTMSAVNDAVVILKAFWKPADVGYKVEVYLADEVGSYSGTNSVHTVTPKSGYTGNTAVADPADYADSTLYVYDATASLDNVLSSVIAADGNTTLVLHYQRAKVPLTVNLAGGTGSMEGPLGSFFWGSNQVISEPSKQGMTFDGWAATGTGAAPLTDGVKMGTTATTATAQWKNGPATYKVEIYLQNADGTYPDAPAKVKPKDGKTGDDGTIETADWAEYAANYDEDTADADSAILANGNLTLTLKLKRKEYELWVAPANGTAAYKKGTYPWGTQVLLTQPVYDTLHDFSGWSLTSANPGAIVLGNVVTIGRGGDTTVSAGWTNAGDTLYTVNIYLQKANGTYDTLNPDVVRQEGGTTGASVTLDGTTAWIGAGYEYDTTAANVFTGINDGSLVLELYYKRTQYDLTVDPNDGTPGVSVGSLPWDGTKEITVPMAPTGMEFDRWTITGAGASVTGNVVKMGTEDAVATAQWKPAEVGYTLEVYRENEAGTFVKVDGGSKPAKTGEIAVTTIAAFDSANYVFDPTQGNVLSGTVAADGGLTLKLYYKRTEVTLTVDANGGTGGGLIGSFPWGSTQAGILTDKVTAPAGMDPDGWTVTAGGEGASVASAPDVTLGADLTGTVVQAKWTPKTVGFKVERYTQGADGSYSLASTAVGTGATTGQLYAVTKAAYNPGATIYDNTANPDGNTDVLSIASIAGDGSSTFKLYYPRKTVMLHIDYNDGPPSPDVSTGGHLWGEAVTVADPVRGGYTFGGWMLESGSNGAGFVDGKLVLGTTDTTIKAKWFAMPEDMTPYRVNIYLEGANGAYLGSPSTSYTAYTNTGSVALPTDGSSWHDDNYTFDSSASNVFNANIISPNVTSAELKLYYKRATVDLTVDLNDDDVPPTATMPAGGITDDSYAWGSSVDLRPAYPPTRAGYLFSHWTVTKGAGAGISADGKQVVMGTTDTEIKANWVEDPAVTYKAIYKVDIYLMDALGSYAKSLTILKSDFPGAGKATADGLADWSGAGYAFDDTNAANVVSANLNPDGTTSAQLALYYARTGGSFTVKEGGSGALPDPGDLVWGTVVTLEENPTRPGYKFLGWVHTRGTGSLVKNKLTLGEDDVVEALWIEESVIKAASYKVQIYTQGADGLYGLASTATGVGAVYDDPYTITKGTYNPNTSSYLNTPDSRDTLTIDPILANGSSTFVLYFPRKTVDLTVNLNNGTGGPGNQSGLLWGAEVTLSDPTREGYTFSRWNVTAGSGAGITGNAGNAGGKLIMGTTDTTIEAVWIPNQGPGPGPEPEPKCKLAAWLQPFLHVGSFIAGFGAGWITRAATMPWWLIVLLVILGMFLFPLFWWIIL